MRTYKSSVLLIGSLRDIVDLKVALGIKKLDNDFRRGVFLKLIIPFLDSSISD